MKIEGVVTGQWRRRNVMDSMESSMLSFTESQLKLDSNTALVNQASSKFGQNTVVGKVRNFKHFSWWEWVFLGLGIVAFSATLGLTIERFVYFHNNFDNSMNSTDAYDGLHACEEWTCISDVTFGILLIINLVFCIFYGIDGVLRERGFEVLAVPIAIIVVLLYLIANFSVYHSPENFAIKLVRLIIALIFGLPLLVIGIVIYIRMGSLQFIVVGNDKVLMRAYRFRSFLATLFLFSFHVIVNLIILAYSRNGTFLFKGEKIILSFLVVFIFVCNLVGSYGIYYEVLSATVIFLVFLSPTFVYYIYKIVDVTKHFEMYKAPEQENNHYEYVAATLLVVNTIALLNFVLIYIFSFLVIKNFNKGLKEKMEPPFWICFHKLHSKKYTSLDEN